MKKMKILRYLYKKKIEIFQPKLNLEYTIL